MEEQVPTEYDLTLEPDTTYQQVVTTIMSRGNKSGKIYNQDWETVDYTDTVIETDLNYLISDAPDKTVFIRNLRGKLTKIEYPEDGTVQDIYNQVLLNGFGRNVWLALENEDAHPDIGTRITFILTHNVRREIPTLLHGKYYSHDTPVSTLNLTPNTVFHLVKYHVGFAGVGCG